MTLSNPSQNWLRAISIAAVAAMLAIAACDPLFNASTFTKIKWDEEGEPEKNADGSVKTEEVAQVEFLETVHGPDGKVVKDADGNATTKKVIVSAQTLNRGRELFRTMCASCHGVEGDGKGPSGKGLVPPPRNFAMPFVVFKFAHVPANQLPNDADLMRSVTNGLHGTAMLKWEVAPERIDQRLREVIQYIKTFSKRWFDEAPADSIELAPDPYAGSDAERAKAIALGSDLYHTKTQCSQCHPAYVSAGTVNDYYKARGEGAREPRPDAHWSVAKFSDKFGVNITPPDFTWHELRSIRPAHANNPDERRLQREDLFYSIGAGIGGTAMPSWKGSIPDAELWAVVYYVQSLMDLRNDSAARNRVLDPLRGTK